MIVAALLAAAWPISVQRFQPIIEQASRETRLPSSWIASVISVESGGRFSGRTGGLRSPVGAMGLMQVMPGTWADMTTGEPRTRDPDQAADNIAIGSAYLRKLYRRFGFPGAFAAYNAGPEAYRRYLSGQIGLPKETRAYVRAVLSRLQIDKGKRVRADPTPRRAPMLFAIETGASPSTVDRGDSCASSSALFVCLVDRHVPSP